MQNITIEEIQANPLTFELESDNYTHVAHSQYGIKEPIKKTRNRILMAVNLAKHQHSEVTTYEHLLKAVTKKHGTLIFHKRKPYEAPEPIPELKATVNFEKPSGVYGKDFFYVLKADVNTFFRLSRTGDVLKSHQLMSQQAHIDSSMIAIALTYEPFMKKFEKFLLDKGIKQEVIDKEKEYSPFQMGGYRSDDDFHLGSGVSAVFVLHYEEFIKLAKKDKNNHEYIPTDTYIESVSTKIALRSTE